MKLSFLILTLLIGNAWAQKELQNIAVDQESKEKFINLTREKLALEIENRKLRDQLKESEQRIKEIVQENQELEKDISTLEKDFTLSEKSREAAESKAALFQNAVDQITQALKKLK